MNNKFRLFSVALFALTLTIALSSCSDDDCCANVQSLQSQIVEFGSEQAENTLVACAAGGHTVDGTAAPLSMFYYPLTGATDFRYYVMSGTTDTSDLSQFIYQEEEREELFGGFLQRFILDDAETDFWARVSYRVGDAFYYCKPVHVRVNEQPSEFLPENAVINLDEPLHPVITFEDGLATDNIIYFHVISDENKNAISGTYTTEKMWRFYDLSNVVFNVTPEDWNPELQIGETYNYTLMGVTADNWVNLIAEKSFVAE